MERQTQDRLELRSRLSDMALLPVWLQGLASRHAISEDTEFAMNLCLEEALSNVIRHGYAGQEDRSVVVHYTTPHSGLHVFVVEDEAPHFNPLAAPDLPVLSASGEIRVGGQGIRLLRQFANGLRYEPMPAGNRLILTFSPAERGSPRE
jgi:serine/threonine-protein kinase RsbW